MSIGLLGRKLAMTQIYTPAGEAIPVTVIQAGPCHVLQLKSMDRDGYEAVQLGYLDKPRRLASRSSRGHVAKLDSKRQKGRGAAGLEALPKADCEPKRFIREFRTAVEGFQVGNELTVALFRPALEELSGLLRELAGKKKVDIEKSDWKDALRKKAPAEYDAAVKSVAEEELPGLLKELAGKQDVETEKPGWEDALRKKAPADYHATVKSITAVDVIGISKGRGTAGVMKRHNFHGQRASHGVKKCHRHAGGIGCSADPSRTIRGKKMAGHYGNARSTVRNIEVVRIDTENNLLLVRGGIPGPNGGFVVIRPTNKLPGAVPAGTN